MRFPKDFFSCILPSILPSFITSVEQKFEVGVISVLTIRAPRAKPSLFTILSLVCDDQLLILTVSTREFERRWLAFKLIR